MLAVVSQYKLLVYGWMYVIYICVFHVRNILKMHLAVILRYSSLYWIRDLKDLFIIFKLLRSMLNFALIILSTLYAALVRIRGIVISVKVGRHFLPIFF